jgi:hypothetical protein
MFANRMVILWGGTVYLWSNGSGTEGEHKELTTPQAQYPLVSSKTTVLGVPTGEGAPQKVRGVGVFLYGAWGRVPQ